MRRFIGASALAVCVVATPTARGYDSRCYTSPGGTEQCKEGPEAVRNRSWTGTRTEHTNLFYRTLDLSGLPASVQEVLELAVHTDGSNISLEGQMVPTARPASFREGVHTRFRRDLRVAELAQLPDFSYSLYDWAKGNETCPLNSQLPQPVDMVACHEFAGHMGASNSNHFVPQSQAFFSHYHGLAMQRAADCREMGVALGSERDRFREHLLECEKEALALESVAHHFLQDAWSAGHMWERWGSPDPSEYRNVHEAVMVGLTAGLIHGARGSLVSYEGTIVEEFHDRMCAPSPEVRWVSGSGQGPFLGLGDLYVGDLVSDASFSTQRKQLFDCAVSSVRAVYEAFGADAAHGAAGPPSADVVMSLDPSSADCFGQRVTNEAMLAGAALDVTLGSGISHHIPLAWIAGALVPLGGAIYGYGLDPGRLFDPLASTIQYNLDLTETAAKLMFYGTFFPDDTDMASGGLPELLQMKNNSAYADKDPLAGYLDPALPWRPDGDEKAAALARAFRNAHAKDWCETIASGHEDFDPRFLREAVAATSAGSPARDQACETCVRFLQPQVRVGLGPADYDPNREPLCHYLAPSTTEFQYAVPVRTDLERQLAATRVVCGCDPGQGGGELLPEGRAFLVYPDANSPYRSRICGVGQSKILGVRLANFETRLPIANAQAELIPRMFGGEPAPDSVEYELVTPRTDGSGLIEVRGTGVALGLSYPVLLVFPETRNGASIQLDFGEVRGPAEIVEGDGYPGGLSPSGYLASFPLPRQGHDWNGVPYGEVALELEGHRIPTMDFQQEWIESPEPPGISGVDQYYDWIRGGYYQARSDPFFEYPEPFTVELGGNFRLEYPLSESRLDLVRVVKLNNTWSTFVELSTHDAGCGVEGTRTTWHRMNP